MVVKVQTCILGGPPPMRLTHHKVRSESNHKPKDMQIRRWQEFKQSYAYYLGVGGIHLSKCKIPCKVLPIPKLQAQGAYSFLGGIFKYIRCLQIHQEICVSASWIQKAFTYLLGTTKLTQYKLPIHFHSYFASLFWSSLLGREAPFGVHTNANHDFTTFVCVCVHYFVIGHCMQGTSCLCKHQCVRTFHLHTHEGYGLWMEMKYFSTGL